MFDELTLLREGRPETPPTDPIVVLRARRVLLRRALSHRKHRNRRRYAVRAVGGVAAIGIMLVSLGVIDLGSDDPTQPGPTAAAAAVLRRAATVTLQQKDPVTEPGQWLRWTQTEQDWNALRGSDGKILTGSDGKPEVFQIRSIRTIWIPHDVKDPWIDRRETIPGRNVSRDTHPFNRRQPLRTYKAFSWADPDKREHYSPEYDPAWYAGLSRNPQKLMAEIMADANGVGAGKSMNWYFQEIFSPVLISPVAPARIRAVLFQALAGTPGIRVTQGLTDLDGRPAVAIRYGNIGHQWLFDKNTGQFTGERETSPDFPHVPGLDDAKTTSLTSVKLQVVTNAPDKTRLD